MPKAKITRRSKPLGGGKRATVSLQQAVPVPVPPAPPPGKTRMPGLASFRGNPPKR